MATKKENDYGPGYLKSENLLHNRQYVTVNVKIKSISPENTVKAADGTLIDKPILWFEGKERGLIMNKTNQAVLRSCIGDDDITKATGDTVTLQVRIVDSFGVKEPAIRIIPAKKCMLRKVLAKRLGTQAVWEGPTPAPEPAAETKPEPTAFEKLRDRINAKTPEEIQAEHGTMMAFLTDQNAKKFLSDDEFTELGALLMSRLPVDEPPTE